MGNNPFLRGQYVFFNRDVVYEDTLIAAGTTADVLHSWDKDGFNVEVWIEGRNGNPFLVKHEWLEALEGVS